MESYEEYLTKGEWLDAEERLELGIQVLDGLSVATSVHGIAGDREGKVLHGFGPVAGIDPLRGFGELAVSGTTEQTSQTHQLMYRPKIKGRKVEIVTSHTQLGERLVRATDYIENSGA